MKMSTLLAGFFLVLFSVSSVHLWAGKPPHMTKEEFKQKLLSEQTKHAWTIPALDGKQLPNLNEFSRPAFKDFKSPTRRGKNESTPQPESLCDEGYKWMGGEAWTSDTDGTAMVWGAGGNFYFAAASDPTHPVEIWMGDIPLRVRLHNSKACFFCYFHTYIFDITTPLLPSLLNSAPGYVNGYWDAYPSPDDSCLIMTDYIQGDLWVFDLAGLTFIYNVANPNSGWYSDMFIVDDKQVAIVGDWNSYYFDFYDISGLGCKTPTFLGQIYSPESNTGLVFYNDGFLYGNYETWQYYNPWLMSNPPDDACWVSVYNVPDVTQPDNNYFITMFEDSYDVVSIKDAWTGVMLGNYQGRVAVYDEQLSGLVSEGFFGPDVSYKTYDAGYSASGGLAACGPGGARFFDTGVAETSHYMTGSYAYDVVASGNYLYVPSGYAGLAILDNTDPTSPVTYSFLEPDNVNFSQVTLASVSPDGNYCYISDGSSKVWVVNISDKSHPIVVSPDTPYIASAGLVQKLSMVGTKLAVGTSLSLDYVDVTTDPAAPAQLDTRPISGGVISLTEFVHSACPGQTFLGIVSPTTFYLYVCDNTCLTDAGSIGGFASLSGVAVANNIAYLISSASSDIHPVTITAPLPFSLSTTGTTVLTIGNSNGPPVFISAVSDTMLTASGDSTMYGYPAAFLVDIGANPLAPSLLPAGQPGIMPFDMLTGLISKNGNVYYATDYFGTGALALRPDFDMPQITLNPTASPIYRPGTPDYIQGTVTLTVKVKDDSSAITKVVLKFYDGSGWRTVATLTNSTPAGLEGTYSYSWHTENWNYGPGNGPIRVEVTDSGCNTTVATTSGTYRINMKPTFAISWDAGCNEPPTGTCITPTNWIVCGDLCFTVSASTYPGNLVSDGSHDDITQIAYAIDGGAWVLYDIPIDGTNPLPLCIDTTLLTDGAHTLTFRVTDDCALQDFKDTGGINSWTFSVYNLEPATTISCPAPGDILGGGEIYVAAQIDNELVSRPVNQVQFYLDPVDINDPTTGTLIGIVTAKDVYGLFSFLWDTTSIPFGAHSVECLILDFCGRPFISNVLSFNLIETSSVPPEVAAGATETDVQSWSPDKNTQIWPPAPGTVSGYRVYRGVQGDLANLVQELADFCQRYDGPAASVDLSTDIPANIPSEPKCYYYIVTAYNGDGEGPAGKAAAGRPRIINSTGVCGQP
jgi:hypothetical protein